MNLTLWAAVATGLQVGAAMVASEAVVAEVGAGRLGFLRYAIGLIVLLPFALRSPTERISRRDLLPVALIGMGQFGLLIAFLNLAVLNTSSAQVSLVFATLPLMTIAVGWLVFRSRIGKRDFAAIILTIAGVAVLVGSDALAGAITNPELTGLIFAALATLTGAVCSTFYGPYLKRYGVLNVSVVAMAASLIPLGVMASLEGGGKPAQDWSVQTLTLVGLIGLSSGIGYLLWLFALKHAAAGIVTGFLSLSPMTAVLLSILFLNTTATASLILALTLVIGGLAITATSTKQTHPA
ncbi:hypothetical protein RA27_00600 [Ruegeria sp. ANG-R]|uniref:DMT family transporter n=1 Tax=Ruegeria sp. ANG-R TaxID=1577903 RepID=UPI000580ABE0|nr:DMT family transporter [Ruegeria sp. ANG-R]KIC41947.1 hypothetical protein RA27_00600 [Ruegeria sp. ANG-R]